MVYFETESETSHTSSRLKFWGIKILLAAKHVDAKILPKTYCTVAVAIYILLVTGYRVLAACSSIRH